MRPQRNAAENDVYPPRYTPYTRSFNEAAA